jgi:hypothetical protein
MTAHLTFISCGTLLLEYPSYEFRNEEGQLNKVWLIYNYI